MRAARSGGRAVQSRSKRPNILVIHGPNLNLLGTREPHIYGPETLETINKRLAGHARRSGATLSVLQSNSEAELIERVHRARLEGVDFVIINPAGFTHTSVALRDALAAVKIAFIEVHLSNVHAREPFRRHSYFSDAAVGVICGLGSKGYDDALEFALQYVRKG
ncbi:MAG: type II 3-dehydroquinate dehydratase [Burkholderiales bacterium]